MKLPEEPIMMTSSSPVSSNGNEYNFLYALSVAGAVIGVINGGIGGFCLLGGFGLVCAYGFKSMILQIKQNQFRYRVKFTLPAKVPNEYLTGQLLQRLMPANICVEADTCGMPVITHNGVIYELMYNDDNTFTVWWRKPLHKAILPSSDITLYRKLVVSIGIIAYHTQQICFAYKENQEFYKYRNT